MNFETTFLLAMNVVVVFALVVVIIAKSDPKKSRT